MIAAMFLDLSDLYHRVNKKYNRKLSFEALLRAVKAEVEKEYGADTCLMAHAYGIQRQNEASGFIACLRRLGIETHFKQPEIIKNGEKEFKLANWELGIGLDAVQFALENPRDGVVILGSTNPIFAQLLDFIQGEIWVLGCNIPKSLSSKASRCLEISEECLECRI